MSPCLYHESMSIAWVLVFMMSPCPYHNSNLIPWVHVYTKSLCQIYSSISIPWGKKTVFKYTEIQITRIRSYKFQHYIKTACRFTDIQIGERQKYQIPNWRNTTSRSVEIQITGLQKYKWLLNFKCLALRLSIHFIDTSSYPQNVDRKMCKKKYIYLNKFQ